jgi:cyclopropane fatty-acyl-phospholipid synthase-like methyltransferase
MTEANTKRDHELERMQRFQKLSYESFRQLAVDKTLSPNERIGFPDEYRVGYEKAILKDILQKLPLLNADHKSVIDIGPGCAPLAQRIVQHCGQQNHSLTLVDSPEMLGQLPDELFIRKVPAYFPRDCRDLVEQLSSKVDVIVTYSVFHYVFNEHPWHDFLDACLQLLAPGGQMLIGDVPNVSKRKRFFSSEAGIRFHKEFTQTDSLPDVHFNSPEPGQIDDAAVLSILLRSRLAGCDAYVLPQNDELPMANRREDILIRRP